MLHQVPVEWEVVDQYAVEPIRVYVEDDGATIVRLAPHEIVGAYTFDMAPPVPAARSTHRKRHSHDGSKRTEDEQSLTAPRRASHPASSRPQAPVPAPNEQSSDPSSSPYTPSASPKLTRLGSALSFFRTHTNPHPRPDQRRRPSSSTASSSDDSQSSGSGSGSSDGDSEAMPRRKLLGRRRDSAKSTSSSGSLCPMKKPAPPSVESPAYRKADLKRALTFARGELMKQVEASGKNALVLEGWSVTVLRQASRYRIRIEYTGRPAIISYPEGPTTEPLRKLPPFLEVIDDQ